MKFSRLTQFGWWVGFFLASAFVGLSADVSGIQHSSPTGNRADDGPNAGRTFRLHCAHCHGPKAEGGRGPALAVAQLARARNEEMLVRIISEGIRGTEMPSFHFELREMQALAKWVLKLGERPATGVFGDVRRGENTYLSRGNCASCHAIEGRGGVAGPDLTAIGLRRGPEYLRRALIDPEADVPENFGQYRWHAVIPDNYLLVRAVTRGGKEVAGARLNEDTFNIQLRDAAGQMHSFSKSELRELHKHWGKSPMPSYREVLSPAEIEHLIAYLVSLRGGLR